MEDDKVPADPKLVATSRLELAQWSVEATADFARTFRVAPGRWLQMESESGTEGAIKRILAPDWPEGNWVPVLTQLWEAHRLQWSAEAAALRFPLLFTPDERAVARSRLQQFGYEEPRASTGK